MEVEVGQIIKLHIPHFRKVARYLLIYEKSDIDHILLSITVVIKGKNQANNASTSFKY